MTLTIDEIGDLLTRAESEKPTKDVLENLNSAVLDVDKQINARANERDRFWAAATDIRTDTKTREAAKKGHSDLEFLIATLDSASGQLEIAFKSVETAIVTVARDESRKLLDAQRQAVGERIKAQWDANVDAIEAMLDELAKAEEATRAHNQTHRDHLPLTESLIRPGMFGGNAAYPPQQSTPMHKISLQRVAPDRPLLRGF